MAAEARVDVHHCAPRCLLGHFDAAAGGFADWSEFDTEAERLSIEVRGLSREQLTALIESSTLEIPTTEHRRLHREASDFVRLEDELRRERQRRASSAGGKRPAPRVQTEAALPVTEVLECRPHEDGYLQLELRCYVRRDGSARERGPYWYFQYHEGGASVGSSTSARPATRRVLWLPSGGSRRTCCPCRLRYLPLRSTPLLSRGQNHPWLAATFKKQCLARAAHHWFYPGGTAWWTASTLLPSGSNT